MQIAELKKAIETAEEMGAVDETYVYAYIRGGNHLVVSAQWPAHDGAGSINTKILLTGTVDHQVMLH